MISGEFLSKKRIEAGLSQTQIANELGYSVQLISLWESGKNIPSISVLGKYASLLHIDLEGIIYNKDSKKNNHCDTNSFNLDAFSKNLKKLRKKKGITQKELAIEISCPTNAIIRFEKGTSLPSLEQLTKLADYYKVSIDNLYFADNFEVPAVTKPKKTKNFVPIILPIILVVSVGGGVTGAAFAISYQINEENKKKNNDAPYSIIENSSEVIDSSATEPLISSDSSETYVSSEEATTSKTSSSELSSSETSSSEEISSSEPSSSSELIPTEGYLYFGSYPQSRETDTDIIDSLNLLTTPNSLGYYEYLDNQYVKMAAFYDPVYSVDVDAGFYFNNDERINDGEEYWFKVEPIKWQVLAEDENHYFLLSSLLIDKGKFDDDSSNYENSTIRTWLNDDFYNKAFDGVKDKLVLMDIDNSLSSTGISPNPFVCNDTNDYVSLLSNSEAVNTSYNVDLEAYTTEYYRARGGCTTVTRYGGYWLRSPSNTSSTMVQSVNDIGKVYVQNDCYRRTSGIRPIITIKK